MKAFTIPYMTAENPKYCHAECPQLDAECGCCMLAYNLSEEADCRPMIDLYADENGDILRCGLCNYLERYYGGKK